MYLNMPINTMLISVSEKQFVVQPTIVQLVYSNVGPDNLYNAVKKP